MDYNRDKETKLGSLDKESGGGAYYPAPEKKKSPLKMLPWLVLGLAISFGTYQYLKVPSAPSNGAEVSTSVPSADTLVAQSEKQALIDAIRKVANAEEKLHASDDQAKSHSEEAHTDQERINADTPQEELQMKQGEAQQKAQEYYANHQDFEAILTKCHINGNDVHFVNRAGEIMKHVGNTETLSTTALNEARKLINEAQGKELWILIFNDRLESVSEKGEVLQTIQFK